MTWKQFLTLLIFNFTTKSPKILENISKCILIIADFNKNNCLLTSMKQLPLELFKSVAFFLGHPVSSNKSNVRRSDFVSFTQKVANADENSTFITKYY